MSSLDLSVIIPLYNEKESLKLLYERLVKVLNLLSLESEILFIDDGSTDDSFKILESLTRRDDRVKVIRLQKNSGKSAALSAGFDFCQGETVITLDADLQDQPEDIPKFLEKLETGFDLISGWRKERKDPLSKTIPSKIVNLFTRGLLKLKIHDLNCGFKAYRRNVTQTFNLYGELYRFIPALVAQKGFKVGEVIVSHTPRKHGHSKFGSGRFLKGAFDFLTVFLLSKYFESPMYLFGKIALLLELLGFTLGSHLTHLRLKGETIGNRPLLFLAILLVILGVQFFSIGFLGELFISSSRKASYTVRNFINVKQRVENNDT